MVVARRYLSHRCNLLPDLPDRVFYATQLCGLEELVLAQELDGLFHVDSGAGRGAAGEIWSCGEGGQVRQDPAIQPRVARHACGVVVMAWDGQAAGHDGCEIDEAVAEVGCGGNVDRGFADLLYRVEVCE